jgi:hypothetical protein
MTSHFPQEPFPNSPPCPIPYQIYSAEQEKHLSTAHIEGINLRHSPNYTHSFTLPLFNASPFISFANSSFKKKSSKDSA